MKHLTVVLPNRPGLFFEVTSILADHDVNVWGYHVAQIGTGAIAQLLCVPHDLAKSVLSLKYGFYVTESDILAVKVPNVSGQLVKIFSLLAKNELNIHNSYQTFDKDGLVVVLIEFEFPSEYAKAKDILETIDDLNLIEKIGVDN